MFALLYGGSLCVIGGLALVAMAWISRTERRKHENILKAMRDGHWKGHAALVEEHQADIQECHETTDQWRERCKRLTARCRELERELTEIKLGTAMAGYTFDQVPARTIPARTRMVKAR